MRENSLVTIVMPAYNSEAFICEAIDSCLAQTHTNIELIVIDDGSTDGTVELVQEYDNRVRLIQQANQGPAIARNAGIRAASGDYIQFCDSDDLLHPDKVYLSLELLLAEPDVALVYSKMQPVDVQGQELLLPAVPPDHFFETQDLFCKILDHVGAPLQTSTLLVRKRAFEAVGGYRADPHQRCAEDWDLLLRLADAYPVVGIGQVLVYYRKHPDSLTGNPLLMAEGRLQTTQYARHYTSRQQCLDDDAYDFFEAGRHHNLAMTLWQQGNRVEARRHLSQAIDLTATGQLQRRLTSLATYIMRFEQFDGLLNRIKSNQTRTLL